VILDLQDGAGPLISFNFSSLGLRASAPLRIARNFNILNPLP
jgi:hypothetical protein